MNTINSLKFCSLKKNCVKSIETSSLPIRVYASRLAAEATPEFNPRGDALLVAAYAQQLSQEEATECYAKDRG